jgi:hypothetical protein
MRALGESIGIVMVSAQDAEKDMVQALEAGKISKREWMKFMEAEFDRLDKGKDGELDVKELTQSKLRASRFTSVGK